MTLKYPYSESHIWLISNFKSEILYGGSVNASNSKEILAEKNISIEELEELFNKVATKKQKFLMNLQRKNLDKNIKSYTLEGKEEEEYNQIENEEESKLQINSNNIFEKLEIRLKEKKENKKWT